MTEVPQPEMIDVDGTSYEVADRQTAKGISPTDGKPITLPTVDELLLTNGHIVYQCVHPNRGDCRKTWDNTHSVTAHQRIHSEKLTGRRAQRELDRIAAEKQAEYERRSNGSARARQARATRYANDVTSENPQVQAVQRMLSDIGAALDKETKQLTAIRDSLRSVTEKLDVLVPPTVPQPVDVNTMTTEEKFALMKQLMS